MNESLLPCIEIDPVGAPHTSIIWLHGLGADGHDFEPIAAELALPEALGVRFVFPHAPYRAVTINGGYVMRAWYDILVPDFTRAVDTVGIDESRQRINALIDREIGLGIATSRIILAGFSQGGVIALEAAARRRERFAGVLALSTYVPLPDQLPGAVDGTVIFMAHGTQDPIIPYGLAQASCDTLERRGYAVEWHSYPMPHAVCPQEIRDIRTWLIATLNAAAVPTSTG